MLFAGEYTLAHAKGEFGVPKAGAAVVDSPMGCPNQLTEVRHRWGRQTAENTREKVQSNPKLPNVCTVMDPCMRSGSAAMHADYKSAVVTHALQCAVCINTQPGQHSKLGTR